MQSRQIIPQKRWNEKWKGGIKNCLGKRVIHMWWCKERGVDCWLHNRQEVSLNAQNGCFKLENNHRQRVTSRAAWLWQKWRLFWSILRSWLFSSLINVRHLLSLNLKRKNCFSLSYKSSSTKNDNMINIMTCTVCFILSFICLKKMGESTAEMRLSSYLPFRHHYHSSGERNASKSKQDQVFTSMTPLTAVRSTKHATTWPRVSLAL